MQGYDAALKLLLQASTNSILKQVTGLSVTSWLNVEMQQVRVRHADLLARTSDDQILHVELQSTNDSDMAVRMAEYSLHIFRQFGKFPKQIVLYVGEPKLRMVGELRGSDPADPDFAFRYALVDFRELDGSKLLASSHIEDNILSILARLSDHTAAIRKILARIEDIEGAARNSLLAQFLIISGLRHLGETVKGELRKMPIMHSLLDHDLLGPIILQSRREGQQDLTRRILVNRLGAVPAAVEVHLVNLSAEELDELAIRALDAASYEELFSST